MADSITFTIKGLDRLQKDLEKAAAYYEGKAQELIELMTEKGEMYAIGYLGHFDTGATQASIIGYRNKKKGFVVAGGAAIWIEFGTGVAYNTGNEHPEVVDSKIPIYPHGGYGKGKGKNPNGWWYYDAQGKRRHTKGIRGNQFMFRTYEKLVQDFPELADEVFNK